MKRMPLLFTACLLLCLSAVISTLEAQTESFQALQAHFERRTAERFRSLFAGLDDTASWEVRRARIKDSLRKMLWHGRTLPGTPPPARVTNAVETPSYRMECLVLESLPGLYATANLYLPKNTPGPFPVVLYQCGHAHRGIYGSKFVYRRHPAWFARNGIACLILDNIEMGELQVTHHGVYEHGWFDWYSRGYSPLAAELLNAVRSLDHLASRPEIDSGRIGATGRSGGGMTSFFLPAVDDRVTAAAPVSGALSTTGWVEGQLAEGHCDCQWPVNSEALFYAEVGAVMAPRSMLLCNASEDRDFPMPAFSEMVDRMREVWELYSAGTRLDTAIAPGGHSDTEAIRLPVYEFFVRELLGRDTTLAEEGPLDLVGPEDVLCLRDGYPKDEWLTRVHERLMPRAEPLDPGASQQDRKTRLLELAGLLSSEVFGYFPQEAADFDESWEGEAQEVLGRSRREVSFNSFADLRVRGVRSLPGNDGGGAWPAMLIADEQRGIPAWGNSFPRENYDWGERAVLAVETIDTRGRILDPNPRALADDDPLHHMRRQAMVCGTTIESMQVYELMRSLEFMRTLPQVNPARITVFGAGRMGVNVLYAALLDGRVGRVVLRSPVGSHLDGPHYLGVLKYTDIPEVVCLMREKVRIYGEVPPGIRSALERAGALEQVVRGSLAECLE